VIEISQQLQPAAERLREGKDQEQKQLAQTVRLLPSFVISFIASFTGFLAGSLGLSVPALGVKPFPFGSALVTSIGMFGIESACVPFTPFARVPLLLCIGKITDKPVVIDGQIVIRPILSISGTIDHRFADGAVIGKFAKLFQNILKSPELYDTSLSVQEDKKNK